MSGHQILVVDDDKNICELVEIALRDEGFITETAFNGAEASKLIERKEYAVIILDIMLPQKDGWEILRKLRSKNDFAIPVIMLTAKVEETDRVLGLELGADDYVTKPFSPRELVARVKALIRRSTDYGTVDKPEIINIGDLEIDINHYKVKQNGREIELPLKEFEILTFLASNEKQIFSREALLNKIWGYDFFNNTRTVDEHIKRLRKKVEAKSKYKFFHTVWGVGYKFEVKSK